MFTENHYHYTALTNLNSNSERPKWLIDKRVAITVMILTLPLFLFFLCYMIISGFSPQLVYPKKFSIGNLQHNVHRANLYSSISKNVNFTMALDPRNILNTVTSPKLVCYYNFPDDASSLQVSNIDPFLCTHIIAAFADVVNNSIYLSETHQKSLNELVKLKLINKKLKILISVGGARNDKGYPEMVLNHLNRKSFIKSILDYVKHFKIDGVDLDWEFPNANNSMDSRQKIHFTQLLEEIRHTVNRQSHKFLLSVAVAAPFVLVESYYDVSYINEFVDFINLMSYDFHFYTKSTPYTGMNSPLYASDSELYFLSTLNVNFSAHFWISMGMKREKIMVGLATFGHTFRLANPHNNNTYAPALGYGKLGTSGFASYLEICSFLMNNQITPIFDVETRSPYASKYYEWISFDNVESLAYKTDFIVNNGFGGAMVYSLNCDDYDGICQNIKFPLINSIRNGLKK